MSKSFSWGLLLGLAALCAMTWSSAAAQGRIVLNGATMNIAQGATLVIDNPAPNAITRNTGHIISEGANNNISWRLGTTAGTYSIPWGYGQTGYLPLSFTKTAGTGSGCFLFSTYRTGWQNSSLLPAGVTNFNNGAGTDQSAMAADRFWKIDPQGYTTKPSLSGVTFSYLDAEFSTPNATALETALNLQRWNSNTSTWWDYAPATSANASANTVSTLASIAAADQGTWWSVVHISDRHWVAPASSNWNDPMNWSMTAGGAGGAGVPTAFDAVFFDDVQDASFTLDQNATVESLIMEPGYTGTITQGANALTVNKDMMLASGTFVGGASDISVAGAFTLAGASFTSTSGTLDVKGNFTYNSGTFVHNNGTVSFSGTTATTQTISGAAMADFNNIAVTNTTANPGVRVESNQNLAGTLTLGPNVIFDPDGTANTAVFKLISTADNPTRDASIGILPTGAQITGNITVQRYMTKEGGTNARIYRYISSPVQNATVADIQSEIPVTGTFTGTSICSGCGSAQSMFAYDETITTDTNGSGTADINDGYIDFPSASNTEIMTPGKGYSVFVRGNVLPTTLWDVRGPINAGNVTPVSLPVSFTSSGNNANDGWNLVGNPFPSAIDWNASSGWTKTNIDAAIYITDNGGTAAKFATWNGVTGTNGGSRYIALGQGFWVKSNGGAPVLQASENVKAPGTQTTFFREAPLENLLRITLAKGTQQDESVIHFRTDASDSFDTQADAKKMPNASLNLSSMLGNGDKLAINSLAAFDCNAQVRLAVETVTAGDYQLKFTEFESFPENISITLKDNFTGTTFDARNGSYAFKVTANASSFGSNRFTLAFGAQALNTAFDAQAEAICSGADALLVIPHPVNGVHYTAFAEDGRLLGNLAGNGDSLALIIAHENLQPGQNTFKIKAQADLCTQQTTEMPVTVNVEARYAVSNVENGTHCKEGTVTLKASGAASAYYNWYESATSTTPLPSHDAILTTPVLSKSKHYYVAIPNKLGCEGERVAVLAEIVHYDEVSIEADGLQLKSSYADGNQWYFNGSPILGAAAQVITPEQSGKYTAEVTTRGCKTTSDYDFIIAGVAETDPGSIIRVFPNPVKDDMNIEIPAGAGKSLREITISNPQGQLIRTIKMQGDSSTSHIKIDMRNYPAGTYIVTLTGTGVTALKVIKVN